ncbi:Golgi SNAP receptor complex member 1 isoform X4 [Rhipicephalus sanguineus]|uniref:Golgi SNAP receptor complex member 1 isoform X4 n=1 Tax=Rhipicephalus sanguineus TaxID=34632 RepID=UPI0020C442AF|nr:Golgi SNAP receptor complex member 1 isoform X4 [Rhipicephalus sanguineus]
MMASAGYALEDLRKQARHLENEIDLKLVSFSKLGTGFGSRELKNESLDTAPLLGRDHMFETMTLEIEQLLSKLGEVNDQMSQVQTSSGAAPSATVLHTLQRHRDILQDYVREFHKTRTNVQAHRERDLLLGSVRKDIDSYKNSSSLNRRSEGYLKEHEHLKSIAIRTKDELLSQRNALKAIQTKMTTLANRFPMINSLVQRINLRKRRDSIILGLVIGTCTVLLLLYITR